MARPSRCCNRHGPTSQPHRQTGVSTSSHPARRRHVSIPSRPAR
jgi:hypothetical protein